MCQTDKFIHSLRIQNISGFGRVCLPIILSKVDFSNVSSGKAICNRAAVLTINSTDQKYGSDR